MRIKFFILLVCSLLLSGCWDEQQYKDITIVPLIGIDGKIGEVKAYFAFPTFEDGSISYSSSTGSGISLREARSDANMRTMEGLELSGLQVILIAEDTAKSDLYKSLDMLFRTPRNRLGGYIAIVEGDVDPYINSSGDLPADVSHYYSELIRTGVLYSTTPETDIEKTATLLFSNDIDLALPYIKMGEEKGIPEIAGIALFSGSEFTGKTLNIKESVIFNLLRNKKNRYTRFTYMWKRGTEESPITIEVISLRRKWKISDGKIDAYYDLKLEIEEFPHDRLDEKKVLDEVEKFLSKELSKEFNEVVKRLQEAKSDSVGFGQRIRAFHPNIWGEVDWHETFSTLPIDVKLKAKIARSGILN
jgi:spore germination protein KC